MTNLSEQKLPTLTVRNAERVLARAKQPKQKNYQLSIINYQFRPIFALPGSTGFDSGSNATISTSGTETSPVIQCFNTLHGESNYALAA